MTEQGNSYSKGNAKHNLDEKAQDNTKAKATDSWLIYLSRDLGKAFSWGKKEVDLLVDSVKSASSTTKRITKRMVGQPKRNPLLSIVRSTGKAARFIQSGTASGISKVGQVLPRRKKGKIKQQTEPVKEESLPQDDSPEVATDVQQEDTPSPANGEAAEPAESEPEPVTEEEPSQEDVSQEVTEEIPEKEDAPEEAVASEPQMAAPSQDEQQTEPVKEESLPQDASPEADADVQQEDTPSSANGEAAEPGESTPASVGMEALLKRHRELWRKKGKKRSTKQPSRTRKIKKSTPTDKTPRESGRSPP